MKASLVAAAVFGAANGAHVHQRHAHDIFHLNKRNETEPSLPVCTTMYTTITGDFIWTPTPNAKPAKAASSSTSELPKTTTTAQAVVPTPAAQTCETPGTYTFPASTLTVTVPTSAVVPSTTACTPGTYTLGGVTTVVETATTIVCPYATVSTASGGVVTSIIESTTYVCPAAGTYTIAPTTTTVTAPTETVTVYTVETYAPGTYTAPAVTTVVTTSTVVYCPFASSSEAVPSTTSTSTSTTTTITTTSTTSTVIPTEAVAETSSAESALTTGEPAIAAAVSVVSSVVASIIPSSASSSSTSSAAAATSSASTLGSSTGSTTTLNPEGTNPWALTYTPYNADSGECQTADAVDTDLAAIAAAGFTTIRVYSTDCDTLPNVGAACEKYGLKMIVGIYIGEAGCDNSSPDVEEQIAAYKAWAQWDLVSLFAVANEAINNGYCTATELKTLINHVKSELPDYTGLYTTTDVVASWQETDVQSEVCDVVDVVSANIHAYFDANTAPEDAGSFVQSQLAIVENACGGKEGFVLESGYPTAGNVNGLSVPSVANQKIAIESIISTIGEKVVFFSMFDDQWKADGSCLCEKHWGMNSLLSFSIST